jgi:hypothetical protein
MRAFALALASLLLAAACDRPRTAMPGPWLTNLTPATHAIFPIASGAHAGMDCNDCHGAFDTFLEFSCIGCHTHDQAVTDPPHASVAGYSYGPTTCYACHPNGKAQDVDHAKIFPIAAGTKHQGIDCRRCHVDPTNRAVLGCGVCHASGPMSSAHGNVADYAFDSTACIRCHGDSQVNRVADHLPFGVAAGYRHYLQPCLSCHPNIRADKAFAADFSVGAASCAQCHPQSQMDDTHQGFPGYQYQVSSCIQAGCHPNGGGGGG